MLELGPRRREKGVRRKKLRAGEKYLNLPCQKIAPSDGQPNRRENPKGEPQGKEEMIEEGNNRSWHTGGEVKLRLSADPKETR